MSAPEGAVEKKPQSSNDGNKKEIEIQDGDKEQDGEEKKTEQVIVGEVKKFEAKRGSPGGFASPNIGKDPNDLFELICILGTGAYGTVHKAINRETGQVVALKVIQGALDEEDKKKRVTERNQHPKTFRKNSLPTSLLWNVQIRAFCLDCHGTLCCWLLT